MTKTSLLSQSESTPNANTVSADVNVVDSFKATAWGLCTHPQVALLSAYHHVAPASAHVFQSQFSTAQWLWASNEGG